MKLNIELVLNFEGSMNLRGQFSEKGSREFSVNNLVGADIKIFDLRMSCNVSGGARGEEGVD